MNNLLQANFARLRKSKVFWLAVAVMFLWVIMMILDHYRLDLKSSAPATSLDEIFFSYAFIIGAFCAVFISLFLGTEYSDGTIRNKIVIGHSRCSVYLANLIVCSCFGLIMILVWSTGMIIVGVPLFGWFGNPAATVVLYFFVTVFMTLSYSAIFTLICMLNQNKAIVAIISVLLFFGILFLGSYCINKLNEPELYTFHPSQSYTVSDQYEVNVVIDDGTEPDNLETETNPKYVDGNLRKLFEIGADFIPGGQGILIATAKAVHLNQMILYSLIIICCTTGIGIICFRHKDLK